MKQSIIFHHFNKARGIVYIIFFAAMILWAINIKGVDITLSHYQRGQKSKVNYVSRMSFESAIRSTKRGGIDLSGEYSEIKTTETGKGCSNAFRMTGHYDINKLWDLWAGSEYLEDQILLIKPRVDWKIGTGVKLIQQDDRSGLRVFKTSYGVICRGNNLLHSFWIKDKAEGSMLGYSSKAEIIIPFNGDRSQEELRFKVKAYLKIFSIIPGVSYNYVWANLDRHYDITVDVGIKI
jgi:hypothetical protein